MQCKIMRPFRTFMHDFKKGQVYEVKTDLHTPNTMIFTKRIFKSSTYPLADIRCVFPNKETMNRHIRIINQK